jgi:hypothetical protein
MTLRRFRGHALRTSTGACMVTNALRSPASKAQIRAARGCCFCLGDAETVREECRGAGEDRERKKMQQSGGSSDVPVSKLIFVQCQFLCGGFGLGCIQVLKLP